MKHYIFFLISLGLLAFGGVYTGMLIFAATFFAGAVGAFDILVEVLWILFFCTFAVRCYYIFFDQE